MNHIKRYQFTVNDFARMGEVGIFSKDDRVELIDGEVRIMSPIGARHAAIVKRLNAILNRQISDQAIVGVQDPVELSEFTEPQPDLTVLRFRDDFYSDGHPSADDILLVIEVADTSLEYDRDEKVPRYAEVGIPEVWLCDLVSNSLTQFTQPENGIYRSQKQLRPGDRLTTATLPNIDLKVEDILR